MSRVREWQGLQRARENDAMTFLWRSKWQPDMVCYLMAQKLSTVMKNS